MTSERGPQLAQIKLHPAVIVLGCFLLSVFGRLVWRLDLSPETLGVLRYMGIALQVIGIAVLLVAYGLFAKAKTTINPSEHTSTIVTSGIYAYSRNPIYLGWFILIAGTGFKYASMLVLLIDVVMLLLLYWAVILKEEAYLESRFGEEYLNYKKRVRRWL